MQFRKFMREEDFSTLNQWLSGHKHPMVELNELPINGFVGEDEGAPICMAFLRMVEGNMAITESLVTDPNALVCKRTKAVDKMAEHIFTVAKNRDIKYLIATSSRTGVISRIFKRHGFEFSKEAVLIKKL